MVAPGHALSNACARAVQMSKASCSLRYHDAFPLRRAETSTSRKGTPEIMDVLQKQVIRSRETELGVVLYTSRSLSRHRHHRPHPHPFPCSYYTFCLPCPFSSARLSILS